MKIWMIWLAAGVVIIGGGILTIWAFSDKVQVNMTPPVATTSPVGIFYEKGNLLLGTDGTKELGTYLIGFNGRPVYQNSDEYVREKTSFITCVLDCEKTWRPYLVSDTSALKNVQPGVQGTVGTVLRADYSLQVTYDGKPLYFYTPDTNTSGPSGDGVGGGWSVARPTSAPPPATTGNGTLSGTMSIGPVCPVEQVDNPCKPTPEMYAARKIGVYGANRTTLITTLTPDASGLFSASLPAGTYYVALATAQGGVGSVKGLPATITIKSGATVNLTVDIDTGIR